MDYLQFGDKEQESAFENMVEEVKHPSADIYRDNPVMLHMLNGEKIALNYEMIYQLSKKKRAHA